MKNSIFLMPVMILLASCNMAGTLTESQPDGRTVTLSVNVNTDLKTKATDVKDDSSGERKVNSLQVLVFNEDGTLDAYEKGNTSSLTVNCSSGPKAIHAVVNHEDLKGISSLSELESTLIQLDAQNKSNLEMYGASELNVSSANNKLTVDVMRQVSRIVIHKITKALPDALAKKEFVIKGIYLCNAAGSGSMDGTALPTVWYNKTERTPSEAEAALYSGNMDVELKGNTSYSVANCFYSMPNPVEEDVSSSTTPSWTPRHTRLVVEVSISGTTYYYPVTLPVLQRGKSYEISELMLTRYGTKDPDIPVSVMSCDYSVTVKDWDIIDVTDGTTI